MGRILLTTTNEKGSISYVAGKVSFIREGQEGRVVNIGMTLNVYNTETRTGDKKYINFAAWNNDDASKPQLADRVRKAKVDAGSYILIRCGNISEGNPATDGTPQLDAKLFDFQYNAFYAVETDDGRKQSIIIGTVRSVKDDGGDHFRVGIPVDAMSNGKKETTWYNVTFANGRSKNADSARKILKQGSSLAILGSEMNKHEYNGNMYNDLFGNIFDIKYTES
jgi:hypothetical protein